MLRALLLALLVLLVPALRAQEGKLFSVQFTAGPKWDPAKPPVEQAHFKEHSLNLARLRQSGLLLFGARYGETGLIVLRAPDEASVKADLARDPAITNGTFNAAVHEFRPFFHGSTSARLGPPAEVVRAMTAAFNRHDPAAVAALLAPEVKWYSVGDGKDLSIEGESRAALQKWLEGYFQSVPDVKSEIFDLNVVGPRVMFRERATYTAKDGQKRVQESISVYEVKDGLIQRAWYFPPEKAGAPPAPGR